METNLFDQRRSVRRFRGDAIPETAIRALLKAAIAAPSAGNCQPWHFYAVTNPEMKERFKACAYEQSFLAEAPLVIVVCAEPENSAERYEERGRELYCYQDTAAAIENILLCAVSFGLGSCWCGAFDEAAVSGILDLPETRRPVALLAIGYPGDKMGKGTGRRPMEEVVTFIK